MTAGSGARDVLLAHQPAGPNAARLRFLMDRFPHTTWGAVVDDPAVVGILSSLFAEAPKPLQLYLDLDCGMGRTGMVPGSEAVQLCKQITDAGGLELAGLHAYDGHNHESDFEKRSEQCDSDFAPVLKFQSDLQSAGMSVSGLIAGGTPTFPIHAQHKGRECSPGTTVLWDAGYGRSCSDLPFEPAAVLLTRVISKPGSPAANRICFDLGHKAVAADKPFPRATVFSLEDARHCVHSEEHLVLESTQAKNWAVGDCAYAIPEHICPTVALHDEVWVVSDGAAAARWEVSARRRFLGV